MVLDRTAQGPPERGVSVHIGRTRPAPVVPGRPALCVAGVCPGEAPWLADLFPDAVVHDTRFRSAAAAVEHVRLRSRHDVQRLPGLTSRVPSRVRDAVRVALTAGVPQVDVVIARSRGAMPWDLERREVTELFEPFLAELLGAAVVLPDIGGPPDLGPGTADPPDVVLKRTSTAIRRLSDVFQQRYQVGLFDVPALDAERRVELFRRVAGADIALCRFTGSEHALATHGWRSAAAAIGGLLAANTTEIGTGLVGRVVPLPPGRAIARNRGELLALDEPAAAGEAGDDALVTLALHRKRDRAVVTGDASFRKPVGEWSLPALRTVKAVHHRLVQTAERFVFRAADDAQAMALANALEQSLRVWTAQGMLVGAGGAGAPSIRGGVDAIPGQPGLHAVVDAQLRPWSHNVVVRVAVRPGEQPEVEVA